PRAGVRHNFNTVSCTTSRARGNSPSRRCAYKISGPSYRATRAVSQSSGACATACIQLQVSHPQPIAAVANPLTPFDAPIENFLGKFFPANDAAPGGMGYGTPYPVVLS